ncbi:MAG TPA: Hsp33 family molecular chaperone HslO [Nevskiaceae bacterium]|nr:Hsp33 family molecular chaperone HslO [Nevskiaceae bacterium]
MSNRLTTFTFEHEVAHGAIVRLEQGVGAMLDHRDYAPAVRALLAEALAAMPLLATHLRFEGRINLQFQNDHAPGAPEGRRPGIGLLVAQVDHQLRVRAMAKSEAHASGDFAHLLHGGTLALMIEPSDGVRSSTQALVPIEGAKLSEALEGYFAQSEQLPTLVRLAVRGEKVAGFLLQRLPPESAKGTEDDWQTLVALSATLTDDELLDTEVDVLLRRLFADTPGVRRFEPRPVRIECNCSRTGISRLLLSLGREEVDSILAEQSVVEVTCEFCGRGHRFTPEDVAKLFGPVPAPPSGTVH